MKETANFEYAAFISYRSSDRKIAEALLQQLQRWRTPRDLVGSVGRKGIILRRLGRICMDRDIFPTAERIEKIIRDYILKSRDLIVLCTPSAADPESWVGREIDLFKQLRPDGEIHCIIADGEPPSCFPSQLSNSGVLPLAADLRKEGDGPKAAVVKLVAGLIGTDFHQLWKKDEKRKHIERQRMVIATFSLAAGVITGAYAWRAQLRPDIAEKRLHQAIQEYIQKSNKSTGTKGQDSMPAEGSYRIILREDLNGDDILDFLVGMRSIHYCGSAGCQMSVWVSSHGTYIPIDIDQLDTGTNYSVLSNPAKKMLTISFTTNSTNRNNYSLHAKVEFNGTSYVTTGYIYCGFISLQYCRTEDKREFKAISFEISSKLRIKPLTTIYDDPDLRKGYSLNGIDSLGPVYIIAKDATNSVYLGTIHIMDDSDKRERFMFIRARDVENAAS